MNNNTLMISVDYLRDNTSINGNTDSELLEPFIVMAQNVHIEKVLGTALFNDVISNIQAVTIAGDNKTLLDNYIQPCLLQWALYESLPFINYKLTNKAITTKSSDNSDSVELSELKYLRGTVRDIAEYYSQRVTDYLKTNIALFPLYLNPGSTIDSIKPNNSSYFNGIFLKDTPNDCSEGYGIGNYDL
jgi:hypothetical protein